mmetsp:Transcript_25983/g.61298  ORF Transcript_25983/g.61298 Transcript_25983/m.61298 type:complete len:443 (-) Transcript_25983:189-1517(-)
MTRKESGKRTTGTQNEFSICPPESTAAGDEPGDPFTGKGPSKLKSGGRLVVELQRMLDVATAELAVQASANRRLDKKLKQFETREAHLLSKLRDAVTLCSELQEKNLALKSLEDRIKSRAEHSCSSNDSPGEPRSTQALRLADSLLEVSRLQRDLEKARTENQTLREDLLRLRQVTSTAPDATQSTHASTMTETTWRAPGGAGTASARPPVADDSAEFVSSPKSSLRLGGRTGRSPVTPKSVSFQLEAGTETDPDATPAASPISIAPASTTRSATRSHGDRTASHGHSGSGWRPGTDLDHAGPARAVPVAWGTASPSSPPLPATLTSSGTLMYQPRVQSPPLAGRSASASPQAGATTPGAAGRLGRAERHLPQNWTGPGVVISHQRPSQQRDTVNGQTRIGLSKTSERDSEPQPTTTTKSSTRRSAQSRTTAPRWHSPQRVG